jgi:hypothetical protein
MRITIQSDIDTITLSDHWLRPDQILGIRKNGIKGLLGTPGYKESFESKPQQDGEYWPSRLTQKARDITIDITAKRHSSIENATLTDRICDLWGRPLTITIHDAHGERTLTGALADDPEPTMRWTEQGFDCSLIIHCPDPHKYGDWIPYPASNGLIQVENTGNMDSWPVVRTTGVSRLTLSLGDQMVVWNGSRDPLTLDFESMQPSQGIVTLDDAFAIPPGRSSIPVSVDAGQLTMLVRPCWK